MNNDFNDAGVHLHVLYSYCHWL